VRIVIAEDAALFRQGLTLLLQDGGHDIVATAADANSAQLAVATQRPELVILDVRMPPRHDDDGAQLAAELRDDHPQLPIVLLSQHVEIRHIVSLATAGYFGYLLKDRVLDVDDFLDALDRVARGGSALDPEVVAQLVAANRDQGVLAALTEREQAVLALMAEGLTNAGIARRLWLTERTVESHIRNLLNKLGILDESGGHRRVLAVLAFLEARVATSALRELLASRELVCSGVDRADLSESEHQIWCSDSDNSAFGYEAAARLSRAPIRLRNLISNRESSRDTCI